MLYAKEKAERSFLMAIRQNDVKIRVYYDKAVITDQEIRSGDLLEAIIAKLIAKYLALRRDVEELSEDMDNLEIEFLTSEEIDEACDYLPVDDSGIKPLTDEQIDEICTD